MFSERHTHKILEKEKEVVGKKLGTYKSQNAVMSRDITRAQTFNKKDENKKKKKDELEQLKNAISDQNKQIEDLTWTLDKEERKKDDKQLVKKMQHHNMLLRQKHTKIHTDISIIDSKIKDLESQN